MTPQQAVLSLGALTLAGSGAGLVLIHDTNPMLKGLNWAGTAMVIAGGAAALTLVSTPYPALFALAQFCILLACLCAYQADRYLLGLTGEWGLGHTILIFLGGLLVAGVYLHLLGPWKMLAANSVLTAIELGLAAALVWRDAVGKLRLASYFRIGLQLLLLVSVLLRGAAAMMGLLADPEWGAPLELTAYCVMIASAVALAFTFFWRTTARLSVELEHMASTDPLTRVFNRRVFMNWCESEQQRSLRLHTPFSLLMLDFDHFKRVNDTFGHHVGDQVLCAAVERVQDSIRGIDVLCRWGGEEFAVLLPNASEEATLIVAERVRRNVKLLESADSRFSEEAFAGLQLSVSIGTATFEGEDDSYQVMLQRADAALYEAKRGGRNRVVRSTLPRAEAVIAKTAIAVEV